MRPIILRHNMESFTQTIKDLIRGEIRSIQLLATAKTDSITHISKYWFYFVGK